MAQQLILMDGSAFLFRAYFSTFRHNLTNKDGFPTGAIFGFINSIKNLQRHYPEAKIIAIFDAKGNNFRHDIYPQYKANRKPIDEELKIQIEPLYEIVRAMGFNFVCIPNVEADDVIATLSKHAEQKNIKVIIASNDKDLHQLINANTTQLVNTNEKPLDKEAIIQKLGVCPEQVIDLLALSGDSSDNIPGIPSVGPKTAVKWLKQYQTTANIKKNAADIKGNSGEKLRNNIHLLDLSYKLIKLKFDVAIPIDIFIEEPKADYTKLAELYKKYDFSAWLRQIADMVPIKKPLPLKKSKDLLTSYSKNTILSHKEFSKLLQRLIAKKKFTFDLETNSLNYMDAKIVGLVFLVNKDSFYVPVAHDYKDAPVQLEQDFVLQKLKPILEDASIHKIGQNLKYDTHVLANYKIKLNGIIDDTMLKSYCLNSVASRHNMDDLSAYYLKHKTIRFADIANKGKKQITFNQVHLEQAVPYACEDVIVTNELNNELEHRLSQYPKLISLYKTLELPLIKVLVNLERNGVELDVPALNTQKDYIIKEMNTIKTQTLKIAKCEFNLESPKQVQQVLFGKDSLNLKVKKKTPGGQASTNEEALKLLDHPLAKLILDYRLLTKLNSTYLEALPKQINSRTKRLHTSYHQAVTATGRLSSSNPNLQNIPIKSSQGANIRGAFIAAKNNVIIAADYSQIELRIMAHISKDKNLLTAFNNNIDVHNTTASMVFNVAINKVTKAQRRNAKAINFGLIYGMSAFGLAKQINTSKTVAKKYIDAYFGNYPAVLKYMDDIKKSAKELGYVETINGRRLYIPQINSSNKMRQQHALRTAINAPMQGSSADIIKKAMLDIDKWIDNSSDIKMIMQVHDELVFEANFAKADEFSTKIQSLMSNAYSLDIPLIVDIGIGSNWQQAH